MVGAVGGEMSDEPPRRPSSLVCRPMSHAFVPLYPRVVFMRKREIARLRVSQMDSTDTQQTKQRRTARVARPLAFEVRAV
jgi:hypothetical protein